MSLTEQDRTRAREIAAEMRPFSESEAALIVRVMGPAIERVLAEKAEREAAA